MQKIVHVQTLPNLHHSYVLDGKSNFAQLGIQHTSGLLHMSTQSSPTLQTQWNLISCNMTALPPVLSNSKILPPPLSHCNFIPPQKNSAHFLKMLLLHYFLKYFLDAIKNCEKQLLALSRLSVHPSVFMEQLRSQRTDSHEILYPSILQNSVTKIQVSFKAHNNNKYFIHEEQYTFLIIITQFILRMRNVSDKSCRENQNTHIMFNNYFSKIVQFMRQCGKIL
jgi:hypothetical protein